MTRTQTSPEPPERAFALQKYLLLHSQHDALQKHLEQITTPTPSFSESHARSSRSSSTDSTNSAPLANPHHHRTSSIPNRRPQLIKRRSSLPDLASESILEEIEEDQEKLKDVNQQIKSTLTELLNCEGVRSNGRYRMWIQTRLMDVEKELKSGRTRSCERRKSIDINSMSHM